MAQITEEGCFAVTFERKYYHYDESLRNDAASMQVIRQHTSIPVPTLYCDFEDDEAYYLIMEYVPGVSMSDLSEDQKSFVREELQDHLATLRTLKSNQMGGPTGIVIPPYRILRHVDAEGGGDTDTWLALTTINSRRTPRNTHDGSVYLSRPRAIIIGQCRSHAGQAAAREPS
ncbi:hypothetical protein F4778DRAFT_730575 [Xylariomycetidae sp. FL2044]|nr:hypothetical protein F4778DRAFT_730575 [Xylariomycetidae sp. FL2044]